MKKTTKNTKKTAKNQKTTKKINLEGATSHKKQTMKSISDKPAKTAQKRTGRADCSKSFEKMTKRELCDNLYDTKRKLGIELIPIGRKTPLTKQEFAKRYLNGIGCTSGFKKDELIQLNKTYSLRLEYINVKKK